MLWIMWIMIVKMLDVVHDHIEQQEHHEFGCCLLPMYDDAKGKGIL